MTFKARHSQVRKWKLSHLEIGGQSGVRKGDGALLQTDQAEQVMTLSRMQPEISIMQTPTPPDNSFLFILNTFSSTAFYMYP